MSGCGKIWQLYIDEVTYTFRRWGMAGKQDEDLRAKDRIKKKEGIKTSFYPGGGFYEIHISGYLNEGWSERLGDLEVKPLENGETLLTGPVKDQSALFGILSALFGLNINLLSVNRLESRS
jgi:hypothetical protein